MIDSSKVQDISREITDCLEQISRLAKRTEDELKYDDPKVAAQFKIFTSSALPRLYDRSEFVKALLQSPLYVGFLGRYSHGKTSLVNALFELSGEDVLPTGDAVTSSCVTQVEFDDSIGTQQRLRCNVDGSEVLVESLNGLVNSREFDDPSLSPGFIFRLPGRDSVLAQQFTKNKISILDMPGLGGPFFEDAGLIHQYLKEMDLVAVVIKATEIDEAASVLNAQISDPKLRSLPKLIVVSFWDEAEASALYSGCRTDDERKEECRKRIGTSIPGLSGHLADAVFTSTAEKIGISNLRKNINGRITGNTTLIRSAKKESTTVVRNRINECKKELRDLSLSLQREVDQLEKDVSSASGTSQQRIDLQKVNASIDRVARNGRDRFLRDAKKLVNQAISSFTTETNQLRYLKSERDLRESLDELNEKVKSNILEGLASDLREKWEFGIYSPLRDEAVQFLHSLQLRDHRTVSITEDELTQELDPENIPDIEIAYSHPTDIVETIGRTAKTARLTITDAVGNTSTVLSVLGGIACLWLASKSDLPLIGDNLEILKYVGIFLFGLAGYTIYKAWKEIKERTLRNSLRDLVKKFQDHFAKEMVKKDLYLPDLIEDLDIKKGKVVGILKEVVEPINNTVESVKSAMNDIFSRIDQTVDKFEIEVKTMQINVNTQERKPF